MATICFTPIRGKRVRVTELDSCGNPTDTPNYVVTEGFIQVAITSEIEAGDEIIVKNADGRICINERVEDSLKRLNVTVDWCNVDPDIISLITGYPLEIDDAQNTVGFRIQELLADKRWALEIWTGLGSTQACGEDGMPRYGWLLLPQITGSTLGELTVAAAAATFQTTGYTVSGSQWGLGPYDSILADPVTSIDHAIPLTTTVPPPPSSCGVQTWTSPTSP